MTAQEKTLIILNPQLKDVPSSDGIMGVRRVHITIPTIRQNWAKGSLLHSKPAQWWACMPCWCASVACVCAQGAEREDGIRSIIRAGLPLSVDSHLSLDLLCCSIATTTLPAVGSSFQNMDCCLRTGCCTPQMPWSTRSGGHCGIPTAASGR